MYNKDDVKRLSEDLGKHKFEPGVEMGEPYMFGLALDLYDPVSQQIITVCRPHRIDIPDHPQVLLTAEQVATAVANARANRAHTLRNQGFASPEHEAAVRKGAADRVAAERDLTVKYNEDMAALKAKEADKTTAVARKGQPNSDAEHQMAAKHQAEREALKRKDPDGLDTAAARELAARQAAEIETLRRNQPAYGATDYAGRDAAAERDLTARQAAERETLRVNQQSPR